MAMPTLVPRYTAEEIRGFPDDRMRYEVIRGELFVTPAPGLRHQHTVLELALLLKDYVDRHDLGTVVIAPFEVELTEDSAVQPDVLVILADRASLLTPKRLMGPPSLAVEVISYTSKRTDRLQKRRLYQEEGGSRVLDRGPRGAAGRALEARGSGAGGAHRSAHLATSCRRAGVGDRSSGAVREGLALN
jgi:Uma2 family endonuclease